MGGIDNLEGYTSVAQSFLRIFSPFWVKSL